MAYRKKRLTSVALISFTDIIMLLLIFILITSSFITYSGIKINLPQSTTKETDYNNNIVLSITVDDKVYLNNDLVEIANIPVLLKNMLLGNPGQVVVVHADQDIPIKNMVKVLDAAKASGHNRFFLATKHLSTSE